MDDIRYKTIRFGTDPGAAIALKVFPEGQAQMLGMIRQKGSRFFPYPLNERTQLGEPTHCYDLQSHALRHLATGRPGRDAIDIEPALAAAPNTPLTQADPLADVEATDWAA